MISAVIDIGSNTIRMSIYKYVNNEMTILVTKKEMVGLIKYVKDKQMMEQGINRACEVLRVYKEIIDNFDIQDVHAFATASLRNILNSEDVIAIIKERTDLDVTIISSSQEASLEFIGASKNVFHQTGVLVDIGGGSTEIVLFNEGKIEKAISMPIGSLNMYTKYVKDILPTKKESKQIKKEVLEKLEKHFNKDDLSKYPIVCGVGGSIRATSKLYNDCYGLSNGNHQMNYQKMKDMYQVLSSSSKKTLHKLLDIVPERCKTILVGMLIFKTIVKYFKCDEIVVSKYGVREGYFYEKVVK
ncbi:Ppx/GppA phosphatase family protein [Tannockella kyphosi]|uniref:Ppx/GppA phosphatase family protein n=1 Tax=Tannockella kyphosi TaxID=2899121 RepID=UPI002012FE18|nr:hypothetical protein [Tannockella kyphosi]